MLPLQARGKQKIAYQTYCTVHFVQDFAIALGHRPNSHEPDVPESDTAALPKCDIRNGSRNPICHNRLYAIMPVKSQKKHFCVLVSTNYVILIGLGFPRTSDENKMSFKIINLFLFQWVPEISHHCQKTPFLLVGTQIDLRDDAAIIEKLAKNKQKPLSLEMGEKLAKELRAVKYVECSALTQVYQRVQIS